MEVNYKNKKRYNTAKQPIRQPIIIVWLIWLLSKFALMGKKYKVEIELSKPKVAFRETLRKKSDVEYKYKNSLVDMVSMDTLR